MRLTRITLLCIYYASQKCIDRVAANDIIRKNSVHHGYAGMYLCNRIIVIHYFSSNNKVSDQRREYIRIAIQSVHTTGV